MDKQEKQELFHAREFIVAKSNTIVQKSRFNLSVPEQKTIAYICSMIKPRTEKERENNTPYILEYQFDIRKYCRLCGIDYDNGKNYLDIKQLLKGLRDKSMWLTLGDGTETIVSWVSKVWCNKGSGVAKVKLDEDMIPFLFDLKEKFLSYGLYSVLAMKSQYSIRIYELLKSYANVGYYKTNIDDFKKLLMVEKIKSYTNFAEFKRKVLEPAIKEINELTDIEISYSLHKQGNKVIGLMFKITIKTPMEQFHSSNIAKCLLGDVE